MADARVIAVDLGASNGRLVEVILEEGKLRIQERYRFSNAGIRIHDRIYTDILYLYDQILKGLQVCGKSGEAYDAIGIDSWGVDFGFLDMDGELWMNPYHYRDEQGSRMPEAWFEKYGERDLFYETGVQNMWYNTVFQLMGLKQRREGRLPEKGTFLMLPDLLGYFLTGKCSLEYTSVSTTQMYDLKNKTWSERIISELGVKAHFPEVLETGAEKGELLPAIKEMTGLKRGGLKLIATAQHDSASAAYAVPAEEPEYLFINSGTWSIIGTVMDQPVVTDEVFELGYSNEGAAFGKTKLVNSIMGMWLVQEVRKCWEREGKNVDYQFLCREAQNSIPFYGFIDVDAKSLVAPDNMEDAIRQYLVQTGQRVFESQGQCYRIIMESLAFKYRQAVMDLERICRRKFERLYLLGGAVQDREFCQYIANATGKEVIAGPVEATAIGNALIQLQALGKVKKEDTAALIKSADTLQRYQPKDAEYWSIQFERYLHIVG